jgi:hypothetical protein
MDIDLKIRFLLLCIFSTLNGLSSTLNKIDLPGKKGYNESVLYGGMDRNVLSRRA